MLMCWYTNSPENTFFDTYAMPPRWPCASMAHNGVQMVYPGSCRRWKPKLCVPTCQGNPVLLFFSSSQPRPCGKNNGWPASSVIGPEKSGSPMSDKIVGSSFPMSYLSLLNPAP